MICRVTIVRNLLLTMLALVSAFLSARGAGVGGDYLVDVWTSENGLPDSSVTAIAQTPDVYLWIGIYNGLARFDGVRNNFDQGGKVGVGRPVGHVVDRNVERRSGVLAGGRIHQRGRDGRRGRRLGFLRVPRRRWPVVVERGRRKTSDIRRPGPSLAMVFMEEAQFSIDDGQFGFSPSGLPGRAAVDIWLNIPAMVHRGSNFAFADNM